jgi:hypothetical protein
VRSTLINSSRVETVMRAIVTPSQHSYLGNISVRQQPGLGNKITEAMRCGG